MAFTFGATTTASSNLFGGFGNKATTTSSGGMFGGFGTKTTASGGGGLFGSAQGFATKTTAAGGLFSSTQGFGTKTTSSGGLFGSTPAFGATKTTASSLFSTNSMFNSKPAGGGLFASGSTGGAFNFGGTNKIGATTAQANNQQQGQDAKAMELLATATSLSSPILFGDAKDQVIIKWNQLQAYWGTGRGFYRKDGACIMFNPQNYFCRFKAVGYSLLPTSTDDKGFVALVCNKKQTDMEAVGVNNLSSAIHKIMGSGANLGVKIESIRHLPADKCEMTIYVTEQSTVTGATRRVFASELHKFLSQNNMKQQLQQQLAMETCVPRVAMTPEQINCILSNPPAGIDPVVWEQAKIDNPDPKSIITVPMLGFKELRSRLEHQQIMAKQHQRRLDIMSQGLEKAKHDLTNTQSKIDLHRRKFLELSHRLLQVVIMQEIVRKSGLAIQPEEELLRVKLEKLVKELNTPMRYRGRLNELLSQTRMHQPAMPANAAILDNEDISEIRKHLKNQQEGLNALVSILKSDFQDLKTIETHLHAEPINHRTYAR